MVNHIADARSIRKYAGGLDEEDAPDNDLLFYIEQADTIVFNDVAIQVIDEKIDKNVDGSTGTLVTKHRYIADTDWDCNPTSADVTLYAWGESGSLDTREQWGVSSIDPLEGKIYLSSIPSSTYDLLTINYYYYKHKPDYSLLRRAANMWAAYDYIFSEYLLIPCYSDDTEILTEKGWKLFSNIEDKERVFTFNKEKEELEIQESGKYQQFYTGKMIHIDSKMTDCLITPNHKVYYKYRDSKINNYRHREVSARKLPNGYFKIPCSAPWKENNSIDLPLEKCVVGGWIIGDGNYRTGKDKRINITQKLFKEELVSDLNKADITFYEYPYKDDEEAVKYYLSTKDSGIFRKIFPTKNISREFLEKASNKEMKSLLEGLMKADGSKSQNIFFTSKILLANNFQELLTKIGYKSHLREVSHNGFSDKPLYGISFSDHHSWELISKDAIKYQYYSGNVYSVSVPNKYVIVRRNGKVMISGNTAMRHGALQWRHTKPYKDLLIRYYEAINLFNKEPYAKKKHDDITMNEKYLNQY